MIIIVTTPLRIAASYALVFAAGVVLACQGGLRQRLCRSNPPKSMPSL